MGNPGNPPRNSDNPRQLINDLLDRGYVRATQSTVRAIANGVTSGTIETRLQQLEAEAARLAEVDGKFTPDNPVVRALIADLEDELKRQGRLINNAAGGVLQSGADAARILTRQLALPGFTDQQLQVIGIRWNQPDPNAIFKAVDFISKDAWAEELKRYTGLVDVINNSALRGIIDGRGPLVIARETRQLVHNLPVARANNLFRTLQLSSYRGATALHQIANAAFIEGVVRIAALDDRTCLCCIALHGTVYPVGTVIQDHHQGRCTGVSKVIGRPLAVRTGEDWFTSLPLSRQAEIAGPGAYEALQSGRAGLRDFVQPYDDPVFGQMVRQGSLEYAIGRAA